MDIQVSRVHGALSPEDELKVATFLHASFSQHPAAPLEFVDYSVEGVVVALRHTLPAADSPDHPLVWLARCPPSRPAASNIGAEEHEDHKEAGASEDENELVGIVVARSFDPQSRATAAAAGGPPTNALIKSGSLPTPTAPAPSEASAHVHNKTFNSHITDGTADRDVQAKKAWLNTTLKEWKQTVLDGAFARSSQPALHVTLLGVAPHIQGHGVGRALMNAVHEEADKERVRVVATCQMERTMKSCLALGYDLLGHDSIAYFGDGPVINHWALERKKQSTVGR